MDLRRVDLNLLRLVEAVLREGSASRAAQTLGLSQPAVSQGLRRARDLFGDPLLARHGNRLMPTPRGSLLLPELRAILDRVEAVLSPALFDPSRAARDFVLGSSDLGQVLILPGLIAQVTREAPHCRIKVVPPPRDAVAAGGMDLALMGAPETSGPLRWQVLFQDRFVLMARHDHPALSRPMPMEDFLKLPQALVSPRAEGFAGPVDAALARQGLRRRVAVMVTNFMSLLPILAESDLVAAVPQRFAELAMVRALCRYQALPVEVPSYAMKAVWPMAHEADAASLWLRRILRDTISKLPEPAREGTDQDMAASPAAR
ncbi:LysR family transcriptional regulator [Tabrizicola sp.]|uniref:LysR family transcriptional regulator n=1 Tax=Tabrizicola sp. TaxID=2005166 RepID=UPI00260286E4|nr:LysR family transcriptional regulator [Tabrizicola sp.]MDM7932726.1 LysR family transcriptional regulator [Tabrizicola sp.]